MAQSPATSARRACCGHDSRRLEVVVRPPAVIVKTTQNRKQHIHTQKSEVALSNVVHAEEAVPVKNKLSIALCSDPGCCAWPGRISGAPGL